MKKPYFVMLQHPNGDYILPLVDNDHELAQFATEGDAREGAISSSLGSEVGYEIFHFCLGL